MANTDSSLHRENRKPVHAAMLMEETMIEEGTMAPDFSLPCETGESISLSSMRGKNVVLYFYPKDNTPGCTKEACSLRDSMEDLRNLDAEVIGISPDTPASHAAFIEKHSLPFHLLSDPEHRVMETYGTYGEKMLYGKKTVGVIRSTFIIGSDGTVKKAFRKVNTATHGEDVRKALAEL